MLRLLGKRKMQTQLFWETQQSNGQEDLTGITGGCSLKLYLAKLRDWQVAKRQLLSFVEILGPDVLENLDNFLDKECLWHSCFIIYNYTQMGLRQHPVIKHINISVVICDFRVTLSYINMNSKQPHVTSGQVLPPNKMSQAYEKRLKFWRLWEFGITAKDCQP